MFDGVMDIGLLRSGFDSQASLVVVSTRKWPQESNSGLSKAVGLVKKKGKRGNYTPIQVDRRPKGFSEDGRTTHGNYTPIQVDRRPKGFFEDGKTMVERAQAVTKKANLEK
jgi:hypothetical protein